MNYLAGRSASKYENRQKTVELVCNSSNLKRNNKIIQYCVAVKLSLNCRIQIGTSRFSQMSSDVTQRKKIIRLLCIKILFKMETTNSIKKLSTGSTKLKDWY